MRLRQADTELIGSRQIAVVYPHREAFTHAVRLSHGIEVVRPGGLVHVERFILQNRISIAV